MKTIPYRCAPEKHRAIMALLKSKMSFQDFVDHSVTAALAQDNAFKRFHFLRRGSDHTPAQAVAYLRKVRAQVEARRKKP